MKFRAIELARNLPLSRSVAALPMQRKVRCGYARLTDMESRMRLMKKACSPNSDAPLVGDATCTMPSAVAGPKRIPVLREAVSSRKRETRAAGITAPHIVWSNLDDARFYWADGAGIPASPGDQTAAEEPTEQSADSLFQSTIEAEMLLLERDLQGAQQMSSDPMLDVDRLAAVIEIVDASASMQGIVLRLADKSGIIAALYAEGMEEQSLPSSVRADRLVWLSGS